MNEIQTVVVVLEIIIVIIKLAGLKNKDKKQDDQ